MERPKILIVDDESDTREGLKSFLSRRIECEVQEASTGKQALEMLSKEAIDVVLLDIKMQGISGMDVLKKAKAAHHEAEIIMVTAYDSQQIAREALTLGAADYIVKPSNMDVLYSKVQHILQKRGKFFPKDTKEQG